MQHVFLAALLLRELNKRVAMRRMKGFQCHVLGTAALPGSCTNLVVQQGLGLLLWGWLKKPTQHMDAPGPVLTAALSLQHSLGKDNGLAVRALKIAKMGLQKKSIPQYIPKKCDGKMVAGTCWMAIQCS